jgi:hypothetical protein
LGLLAFLADIPVWFMAVAQFRPVAPNLPHMVFIGVLFWITLQELLLSFTVSKSLKEQFIKRILFFLVSVFCSTSFILAALIVPGTFIESPIEKSTIISSPVKGTWQAMHAGEQKWVNYHSNYPPQMFAIDMVKIGESGRFFMTTEQTQAISILLEIAFLPLFRVLFMRLKMFSNPSCL